MLVARAGRANARRVDTSKAVLAAVLPVYLLILAGALLRKIRVLRKDQDDPVFRLVFNVLYPCLILDKILGSESVRNPGSVLWGIGIGFGLTVLSFGGAWLAAGLLGFHKGTGKRTFALSSGVQNFGYTAIPVVEQLWVGGGAIAMLFVHNLGVELAIWSVGVMILSGDKRVPWRQLVNGPVISVLLGLILVGTGADKFLTPSGEDAFSIGAAIRKTMAWIGAGAFPVAILITGALRMRGATGGAAPPPAGGGEVPAGPAGVEASACRSSRHAIRDDADHAGQDLWWPTGRGGAGGDRHHGGQPLHPSLRDRMGEPLGGFVIRNKLET